MKTVSSKYSRKSPKKLLGLALATFLVSSVGVTSATADYVSTSPRDSSSASGAPPNFDIDIIRYIEFSSQPDLHYFAIHTKGPIQAKQFNDGQGSWAFVSLDSNLDGVADYRIQTTAETLVGRFASPALVARWQAGSWKEMPDCSASFYGNLDDKREFVAFQVPYSCFNLPETFGFDAYMDYIGGDNLYFDYYPDDEGQFFTVKHSFGKVPTVSISRDKPRTSGKLATKVANPSQAPSALEKLSPKVVESVVTIFCGQGVGSGWSPQIDLAPSHKSAGYQSFIVTNHHVIEDCIGSGAVTLELSDGRSQIGRVVSWDEANDLAGIVTTAKIPGLQWRGEIPKQGWWVGVLGAPRGLSGYLTTGLISIVSADSATIGTTAPVNPGNSGGPIFDKAGRVLGTVSWKVLESEGLGFAKSNPLLCLNIIDCSADSLVWTANPLAATPNVSSTRKFANCGALNKIYPGGVSRSASTKNKGASTNFSPTANLTAYNVNKSLDRDRDGIACER